MGPPPRTMPWIFRQVGRQGILTGAHIYIYIYILHQFVRCTVVRLPFEGKSRTARRTARSSTKAAAAAAEQQPETFWIWGGLAGFGGSGACACACARSGGRFVFRRSKNPSMDIISSSLDYTSKSIQTSPAPLDRKGRRINVLVRCGFLESMSIPPRTYVSCEAGLRVTLALQVLGEKATHEQTHSIAAQLFAIIFGQTIFLNMCIPIVFQVSHIYIYIFIYITYNICFFFTYICIIANTHIYISLSLSLFFSYLSRSQSPWRGSQASLSI